MRDELRRHVDSNDKVLTLDVTGDSWASNFTDAHTDWMHNNMGYARAA